MPAFLFKKVAYVALLAFLSLSWCRAENLSVIVAADAKIEKLSRAQVRKILLRKEVLTTDGDLWTPVNLNADHPIRKAFTESVLDKSMYELNQYWNELYFNGISPPHVLASEEAVIRFVVETPNAIGYVLGCHVDGRVKVIYRLVLKKGKLIHCH